MAAAHRVSLAAFRGGDAEAATQFVGAMRQHGFVVFQGDDPEANAVLRGLVMGTDAFFRREDRASFTEVCGETKAHGYPLWGTCCHACCHTC